VTGDLRDGGLSGGHGSPVDASVTVAGRVGYARLMDDGRSCRAELLLCVGGRNSVHPARPTTRFSGFWQRSTGLGCGSVPTRLPISVIVHMRLEHEIRGDHARPSTAAERATHKHQQDVLRVVRVEGNSHAADACCWRSTLIARSPASRSFRPARERRAARVARRAAGAARSAAQYAPRRGRRAAGRTRARRRRIDPTG